MRVLHLERSRVALVAIAVSLVACTGAKTLDTRTAAGAEQAAIGYVQVSYDTSALAPDRLQRAKEIRLARAIEVRVRRYVRLAGLAPRGGTDTLWVHVNAMRLPRGMRWYTGALKGNDRLAALTGVMRGKVPISSAQVTTQLGAGDRTIAADYSANQAKRDLVEMLAWEIVWNLSGTNNRIGEDKLLRAGKRASIKPAILILAHRGQLSYGEFLKFGVTGQVGLENAALSAKYDACGLRKVFTFGLSECGWDEAYR